MFNVFIRTNKLSDGSEVHNVVLVDKEGDLSSDSRAVMEFHAYDFDHAHDLMTALRDVVNDHTNDDFAVEGAI